MTDQVAPTTVELELAIDTSKFLQAIRRPAPTSASILGATAIGKSMARVQAAFEDSQVKIAQMAEDVSALSGYTPESIAEAMQKFADHYAFGSPTNELRHRLNARLRGEDPGQPVNWKGLSGR